MTDTKLVTIVIPVYNEAKNITPTIESVSKHVSGIRQFNFEILFVDDGSTDATVKTIQQYSHHALPVGYLKLSRNFGHQVALEAGINFAAGDVVITMDGDLQHPADMIPKMIEEYVKGADIVQMQRANIKSTPKGIISVMFYSFFSWVSDAPVVSNAADFRLMSRLIVDEIKKFNGRGKLLRAIIPELGFKQVLMPYIQPERKYEKPKYTYFSSYELGVHTLFKFSRFPAHALSFCGVFFMLLALVLLLLLLFKVAPSSVIFISFIRTSFLAGLIFISSGIICWYLYFILEQVRSEPSYIVAALMPPGYASKHK